MAEITVTTEVRIRRANGQDISYRRAETVSGGDNPLFLASDVEAQTASIAAPIVAAIVAEFGDVRQLTARA